MIKNYKITPVAKPRMTQSDKWKVRPCVAKYRAFKDEVRLNKVELPTSGADILFILPMPKSWSKKKRQEKFATPHRQVPDLSNILKALEDSVYDDDSAIWNYKGLTKMWGYEGSITIEDF